MKVLLLIERYIAIKICVQVFYIFSLSGIHWKSIIRGQNFFNNHWCLVPFITNLIDTQRVQNVCKTCHAYQADTWHSCLSQAFKVTVAQSNPISKTLFINAYVSRYHFMPNTLVKTISRFFTILIFLFQYQNIN